MTRRLRREAVAVCFAAGVGAASGTTPPDAPVLLLGEVHDNRVQHERRLDLFERLLAAGARPALVMEQFDRERQPEIDALRDRLRASSLDPDAGADMLIALAGPRSGWDWSFYRPFIALALRYDLPIVAANVSRADAGDVIGRGLAANGFDARVPSSIDGTLSAEIEASHCGLIDAATAHRMTSAQVARDQYMARMVDAQAARGVVLLAGNGHVRRDTGVANWLSAAIRDRAVAIGFLEEGDPSQARYDRVFVTPRQPREDPCARMRPPPLRGGAD